MALRSIRIDSELPTSVQEHLPRLLSQALTRSIPRGALMRASFSLNPGAFTFPFVNAPGEVGSVEHRVKKSACFPMMSVRRIQ